MNSESARDPYVGLNRLIDERAEGTRLAWYAVGKLLSLSPLRIRADGMDLDSADLRVPESLFPNFRPGEAKRGIRAALPKKDFTGTCQVMVNGSVCQGTACVTRPQEDVYGTTPLAVGDEVLLLRSGDGQTYYLIERMVKL